MLRKKIPDEINHPASYETASDNGEKVNLQVIY